MEETESPTEPPAVLLDREPHQRVDGVVVDDQHFEVGIVEPRERVERLDHELRRLVVRGHVDRHLRQRRVGDPLRPQRCAGAW